MTGSSTRLCSPLSWSLSPSPPLFLGCQGRAAWSPGWVGGTEGPKKGCHGWAGCPVLAGGSGLVRQRGSLHKHGS